MVYRRNRGDAIETYKYLHGKYRVDETVLLPLAGTEGMMTRGNSLKLQKRTSRTKIRANYFGYRVVNGWNALPEEIVNAATVNEFKGRYDRFCKEKRFLMEDGSLG